MTFNFEYIALKALLLLSLVISAYSQGQVDRRKGRNHLLSALSEIIPLFGAIVLMEYFYTEIEPVRLVSAYVLLRLGLFDMFWNLGNGQKINYKGVTPYWYVKLADALTFRYFPLFMFIKWFSAFIGLLM